MIEEQLTWQQREFIRINHWLMTIGEMVDELNQQAGKTVINYRSLRYYCHRQGFKPARDRERASDFIRRHPEMTIPQLAAALNLAQCTIRSICKT